MPAGRLRAAGPLIADQFAAARRMGVGRLYLETNSGLTAAEEMSFDRSFVAAPAAASSANTPATNVVSRPIISSAPPMSSTAPSGRASAATWAARPRAWTWTRSACSRTC